MRHTSVGHHSASRASINCCQEIMCSACFRKLSTRKPEDLHLFSYQFCISAIRISVMVLVFPVLKAFLVFLHLYVLVVLPLVFRCLHFLCLSCFSLPTSDHFRASWKFLPVYSYVLPFCAWSLPAAGFNLVLHCFWHTSVTLWWLQTFWSLKVGNRVSPYKSSLIWKKYWSTNKEWEKKLIP